MAGLLDYSHLFVIGLDEIHTKDELCCARNSKALLAPDSKGVCFVGF